MIQFNFGRGNGCVKPEHSSRSVAPIYSREAFRAILARQPEWKIRAALEEGNIPCSNVEHAIEWLEEQERAQQYRRSWS
ncbi:hypothetical protein [Massilia putida]|uniref:hypothetical protein n=1 Tax=Massilia putida TaxID=1141883 RepID=UPI0012EB955B|nr:hypothetical protein [Massilia putida]